MRDNGGYTGVPLDDGDENSVGRGEAADDGKYYCLELSSLVTPMTVSLIVCCSRRGHTRVG